MKTPSPETEPTPAPAAPTALPRDLLASVRVSAPPYRWAGESFGQMTSAFLLAATVPLLVGMCVYGLGVLRIVLLCAAAAFVAEAVSRAAFVQGGSLDETEPFEFQGNPGVEGVYFGVLRDNRFGGRIRIIRVGNDVLVLLASGWRDACVTDERVDEFFQSLEIRTPAED